MPGMSESDDQDVIVTLLLSLIMIRYGVYYKYGSYTYTVNYRCRTPSEFVLFDYPDTKRNTDTLRSPKALLDRPYVRRELVATFWQKEDAKR